VIEFNPKPCPCGCKKWIMHPLFGCQCSSLSTEEKDEFMEIVRDAIRYRTLRLHSIGILMNPDGTAKRAGFAEQSHFDATVDIMVIQNKEEVNAS